MERRSEAQIGRYNTSPTPKYRSPNPRIVAKEQISQPTRHKHIADPVYCVCCVQSGNGRGVESGHEYNETNLPFRQRTNSTTSIGTIRIRSTTATTATSTKLKNDTDVVTPTSRANSATPIKQISKQKPAVEFFPTQSETTSSLSLITTSPKAPRKKKIKKGGSGPVPNPPPTIFNVGQSSLLSGLVNIPSSTTATTRSAFSLDEILDMDSLPFIPSPPDSPKSENNTVSPNTSFTSYSASSDAPFSTPYDEDALLENEIPFPLNKHSNVIIENMGIKKAKNLYKGKERLLNRYITTVGSSLRPHSGPTLPLPLHSIHHDKTAALSPMTFQNTYSGPTTSGISAGPASSKKDAWGCMHLGAADCELSIAFPQTSHYEVWDMGDDAFFACPVFLCLMAKDPNIWAGTPLSLPDVSLVDIRCDDLPVPSPMSVYDPTSEYGIQCTVPQKNAWERSFQIPPSSSSHLQRIGTPFIVDHKEITIDGKWERIYTQPKKIHQTKILHIAEGVETQEKKKMMVSARGWYLKIWIPVPSRLFVKRETRIFEIKANVWMMGDEERAMDSEGGGEEGFFPLVAETEMTVSHLRMERQMW